MEWYAIAAAVIVLLIVSPRFRYIALFACLAFSAIGGGYYLHSQYQEIRSKKRIPIHDIKIEHMDLQATSFGNYRIIGRIDNNSADYTLNSVSLRIFLEDCVQDESGEPDCEVIGEATEDVHVNSPPQQTREFEQYVYFFGSIPKTPPDKPDWHYVILHTHGE